MRKWTGTIVMAAVAAAGFGCAQKPADTAAVIEDRTFVVTPDRMMVQAGIVTGEITEMKVTERVEQGSGRVAFPARFSGKLSLKNGASDQAVRLLSGKLVYIDDRGQPIDVSDSRSEPVFKFFTSGYNDTDRLDPGQHVDQSVEVDFPAAALKDRKLGEIRIELKYIPVPLRQETARASVSLVGK